MELEKGHQIYINNKYFLDVIEISNKLKLRVKYKENDNDNFFKYTEIDLPLNLFQNCKGNEEYGIIYCNISNIELKKHIGGLINKMVKEPNIYELFENAISSTPGNTAGMGSVSMPSMSGTPGIPGGSGSGDISGFLSTGSKSSAHTHFDFGMQKLPKGNKKHLDLFTPKSKSSKKKSKKKQPKTPVFNTLNVSENIDINIDTQTENSYKAELFNFLDLPVNNDYDKYILDAIGKYRNDFKLISSERIKNYLKIFYETNKNYLNTYASENILNNILKLAEI